MLLQSQHIINLSSVGRNSEEKLQITEPLADGVVAKRNVRPVLTSDHSVEFTLNRHFNFSIHEPSRPHRPNYRIICHTDTSIAEHSHAQSTEHAPKTGVGRAEATQ